MGFANFRKSCEGAWESTVGVLSVLGVRVPVYVAVSSVTLFTLNAFALGLVKWQSMYTILQKTVAMVSVWLAVTGWLAVVLAIVSFLYKGVVVTAAASESLPSVVCKLLWGGLATALCGKGCSRYAECDECDEKDYLGRLVGVTDHAGLYVCVFFIVCLQLQLIVHTFDLEEKVMDAHFSLGSERKALKMLAAYLTTFALATFPSVYLEWLEREANGFLLLLVAGALMFQYTSREVVKALDRFTRCTSTGGGASPSSSDSCSTSSSWSLASSAWEAQLKLMQLCGWSAFVASNMFAFFSARHLARYDSENESAPLVAQKWVLLELVVVGSIPAGSFGALLAYKATEGEEDEMDDQHSSTAHATSAASADPSTSTIAGEVAAVTSYLTLGTLLLACTAILHSPNHSALANALVRGFGCTLGLLATCLLLAEMHRRDFVDWSKLVCVAVLSLLVAFTILYQSVLACSWHAALKEALVVVAEIIIVTLAARFVVYSYLSFCRSQEHWEQLVPQLGVPPWEKTVDPDWILKYSWAKGGGAQGSTMRRSPVPVKEIRQKVLHLSLPLSAPGYISMIKDKVWKDGLLLHRWLDSLLRLYQFANVNPFHFVNQHSLATMDAEMADAIVRLTIPKGVLAAWQVLLFYCGFVSVSLFPDVMAHKNDTIAWQEMNSLELVFRTILKWIEGWSTFYRLSTMGNAAVVAFTMVMWSRERVKGRRLWALWDVGLTGLAIFCRLQSTLVSIEIARLAKKGPLSIPDINALFFTVQIALRLSDACLSFWGYRNGSASTVLLHALASNRAPSGAQLLTVSAADLRASLNKDSWLLLHGLMHFNGVLISKGLALVSGSEANLKVWVLFSAHVVLRLAPIVSGRMVRLLRTGAIVEQLAQQSAQGKAAATLVSAQYSLSQDSGRFFCGMHEEGVGISLRVVQRQVQRKGVCDPDAEACYFAEVSVEKSLWVAWTLSAHVTGDDGKVVERFHVAGETAGGLVPAEALLDVRSFFSKRPQEDDLEPAPKGGKNVEFTVTVHAHTRCDSTPQVWRLSLESLESEQLLYSPDSETVVDISRQWSLKELFHALRRLRPPTMEKEGSNDRGGTVLRLRSGEVGLRQLLSVSTGWTGVSYEDVHDTVALRP